jgi:hypothetical protein
VKVIAALDWGDRAVQKVGEAQYSLAGFTDAVGYSQYVQLPPDVENNTSSDQLHPITEPSKGFIEKPSFVSVHEYARRCFFPSPESRNSTLIPSLRASSAHAAQTFISMI